jgi:PAS domain-containing protein
LGQSPLRIAFAACVVGFFFKLRPGAGLVTPVDPLAQDNQRLQAQALELARANEALKLEIAEQKRAIEALRSSAQGLRNLATISADWYWEQDAEHRFVKFFGEQAGANMDAERNSNLGKRRWELPGAVALSSSWEAHRAVLDAHQPFRNFEYMRVLGDGLPHYLSVSGVPVFDLEGKLVGYRGTVHNISTIRQTK